MNNATLYHGDCLEEMKKIPDGSVDLVVTDPPTKSQLGVMVATAEECFKRKK